MWTTALILLDVRSCEMLVLLSNYVRLQLSFGPATSHGSLFGVRFLGFAFWGSLCSLLSRIGESPTPVIFENITSGQTGFYVTVLSRSCDKLKTGWSHTNFHDEKMDTFRLSRPLLTMEIVLYLP